MAILLHSVYFPADPFNPRVNDVYSYTHHSIPKLMNNSDKNNQNNTIQADLIVVEVTDKYVRYFENGKSSSISLGDFAAFVCTRNLIPQFTLSIFNEFRNGNFK